jgi:glycine betaine/proline transport system ATP-binding protein
MQRELLRIQEGLKKTVVFITHDVDEAVTMADRIAILREGLVVQEGRAEEIVLRPMTEYVAEFVRGVNLLNVLPVGRVIVGDVPRGKVGMDCRAALSELRGGRGEVLYVTDDNGRLVGAVSGRTLGEAITSGRSGISGPMLEPIPTIQERTLIKSVFPLLTGHTPVAATDAAGQFVGIVDVTKLFELLGRTDEHSKSPARNLH